MAIFNLPRSFQNVNAIQAPMGTSGFFPEGAHSSHPSFFHLVLLVFEAVLEVVCVSLPGYIAARQGMFDADAQKLVANLNVTLFTPCLSMETVPEALPEKEMRLVIGKADSCSFHKIGLTIDRRETDGPGYHPCHLRRPDLRVILLFLGRYKMLWLQETPGQFCGCHGGM